MSLTDGSLSRRSALKALGSAAGILAMCWRTMDYVKEQMRAGDL